MIIQKIREYFYKKENRRLFSLYVRCRLVNMTDEENEEIYYKLKAAKDKKERSDILESYGLWFA